MMKRKDFLQTGLTAGALLGSSAYLSRPDASEQEEMPPEPGIVRPEEEGLFQDDFVIERAQEGRPHEGKVLLAIQPHSDDIPLFAGGTVAKLVHEGYKGYMLRTSNDEKAGRGDTVAEVMRNNEIDNENVVKALGLEKSYDFYCRNHQMREVDFQELVQRLVFLIRLLEVDTIVCYDPWAMYEENPDHYVTAQAVEAARWMAGNSSNYPEHFEAGLESNSVSELYYYARYQNKSNQHVNRIVDISEVIDVKVRANMANVTQGPGGENGSRLRRRLAEEGRRLPILGDDDETANFNYIKHFLLDRDSERLRWGMPSDRKVGEAYGLEWAERIHYIGPSEVNRLNEYIEENAERI